MNLEWLKKDHRFVILLYSFKGSVHSLKDNPCYESIAFKELYFGAGWDHTGDKQQPRHIHSVKESRVAILTTRPPGSQEPDRLVIACLFIKRVNDDPGKETMIYGDQEKSILIPYQSIKIRFWNYYKNAKAEDIILWASGLVRYVPNGIVLKILKATGEAYTNANLETNQVINLIKYYEQLKSNK